MVHIVPSCSKKILEVNKWFKNQDFLKLKFWNWLFRIVKQMNRNWIPDFIAASTS